MNECDALLILNAIPGVGNATVRKLVSFCGSAQKLLSLNAAELQAQSFIPTKTIDNILHFPKEKFFEAEQRRIKKHSVKIITFMDDHYPASLCEIPDAPVVLYVKGELPLNQSLSMAIVGSRRASFYGVSTSAKFGVRLAELGFTVVSGMARGVDAAAHKGALRVGGQTIAVLGSGLANIYPSENRKLFEQIVETGAVISEFPMETAPLPYNFPRRNRIISGLSLGVIVVEAAQRSGALITADFALEQGREVFAVPGKIDHPASRGVHNLIKQGAKLVMCVDDILEDLKPHVAVHLESRRNSTSERQNSRVPENKIWGSGDRGAGDQPAELSDQEHKVLNRISDKPVHVDELAQSCGSSVPVMSVLLQLELKRLVKQLPGKLFVHK